MSGNEKSEPLDKKFFTTGMKILTAIMVTGLSFGMYRMIFGLAAATNLNDQFPLGLWIGLDDATGAALAAGGFTTGALVYLFNRKLFSAIIRPALLTTLLGVTFVAIGLEADLGRWYNIWHVMIPFMWQGDSALFEVGMCAMVYLIVLYLMFVPIVCERFIGRVNLPGFLSRFNTPLDMLLRLLDHILGKTMFVLIAVGIVVSCLYQSSLGTLMVIAPYKLHPLYWSVLAPVFFLLSAIAVGFPMVIFESMIASRAFDHKPEMHILTPLARMIPFLIGAYICLKVGDMIYRGTYVYLFENSIAAKIFWVEFGLLTVVPFLMFLSSDIRRSPLGLFVASAMYIGSIFLNRCSMFFIAFNPVYADKAYIPAVAEFALSVGLIASIIFLYRLIVTICPVLPVPEHDS